MDGAKAVTISATVLGGMSLDDFCERCFWIERKCKLPWQKFPGIFNTIDGYTKDVTLAYKAAKEALPVWLEKHWPGGELMPIPHWSKFSTLCEAAGVAVRGTPDLALKMPDGSVAILDYKTAKITAGQDKRAPVYKTQLNSYAYIAEAIGWGKVSSLALVYCEPQTGLGPDDLMKRIDVGSFDMTFMAEVRSVELDLASIPALLMKVAALDAKMAAPASREGCEDCKIVDNIVGEIGELS